MIAHVTGALAVIAAAPSAHHLSAPLAVAGLVLLAAAAVVRKILKLAFLVAVAGAAALAYAAWRSGYLG